MQVVVALEMLDGTEHLVREQVQGVQVVVVLVEEEQVVHLLQLLEQLILEVVVVAGVVALQQADREAMVVQA
jgi:hypothetical protein